MDYLGGLEKHELIELIETVMEIQSKINDICYEKELPIEGLNLMIMTDGFATMVEFGGLQIWNSEDDNRRFDKEANQYESFESFLNREIEQLLLNLNKLRKNL